MRPSYFLDFKVPSVGERAERLASLYSHLSSIFVTLIGLAVLTSWFIQAEPLSPWIDSAISMKPNAALCFILSGLGLWLVQKKPLWGKRERALWALASAAVLIGVLTAIEHQFQIDFGFDAWLVPHPGIGEGESLRMAYGTAINFIVLSVILTTIDHTPTRWILIRDVAILLSCFFSFITLLAHLFNAHHFHGILACSPMALSTACCFVLMGTGILAARPTRGFSALFFSSGTAGSMLRTLVPALLIITPFVGRAVLFGQEHHWYDISYSIVLLVISFIFISALFLLFTSAQLRSEEFSRVESERFLSSILHHLPDMVFVKDSENLRFRFLNQKAQEICGYSMEEMIGKSDHDLFPAEMADRFTRDDREILKKGGPGTIAEEPIRGPHGKERMLRTKKIPIYNDQHEPIALLGISEDITAIRESERERRNLIRAIEQTTDGVVITDAEGTIEYVNPAFERLTGYSLAETVGKNPRILKSGQVSMTTYKNLWETILSGRTFRGIFTNRKKNADTYVTEITISPIRDPGGVITHFVAVQKDITEQVRLERAVAQTEKLAAVGQLAAGIAHELNNPLSGIMGYSQLLLDDSSLTPQQREDLNTILTQSQRCRNIIQNLLQFSRPKLPKTEQVSLPTLIQTTLQLLNYELSTSGIRITSDLPGETPMVIMDPDAMQQILINLITNARHALEGRHDGEIRLRLSHETNLVRLEVEDNGPGIPKEIQSKIFNPFFTTKEPGKGTGLGLSICHSIMQRHQGHIYVESEEGKGARFILMFPISKTEEAS